MLTHYPREPLVMQGGTTFTFVTDGIESALEQARAATGGDGSIAIAGGADTVRQYLRAGLIDELHLHTAPILLGEGERIFDEVGDLTLEPLETTGNSLVTHVKYRVTYPRLRSSRTGGRAWRDLTNGVTVPAPARPPSLSSSNSGAVGRPKSVAVQHPHNSQLDRRCPPGGAYCPRSDPR